MISDQIASECVIEEELFLPVAKLERKLRRLFDRKLAGTGLSISQITLLAHLSAKGPLHSGELCNVLSLDKSSLSRNLKYLAGRGLVVPTKRVGRTVRVPVVITQYGLETLRVAMPVWQEAQREISRALTPKERRAIALLRE